MSDPAPGRIEAVPLRKVWPKEDKKFTPWLSENLDSLSKDLGLELQDPQTEVAIGDFRADLVARTPDERQVVIKNQLEESDHEHLGKLLTYLTGQDDPAAGIWIARSIRPEHRRALGWLNHSTLSNVQFFGVEVKAIKIGDSDVAPQFTPIVFPGDWNPNAGRQRADDAALKYRGFFARFQEEMGQDGAVRMSGRDTKARRLQWRADPQSITYRVQFLQRDQVSVALIIEGASRNETKFVFDRMHEQRGQVEAEVGTELQWSKQPNRPTSLVRWRGTGDIHGSGSELEAVSRWMRESLARLREVCNQHLDAIVATLGSEEEQ